MGTVFEELVRKFNEENNEEAGEHWTPRDAVRLMANLIFLPIADQIESGSYLLYDGAVGTGGMLTVAEETLLQIAAARGKQITTHLYGQEINPETYAICKADMLLKGEGENADHIVGGAEWSTLSHDAFPAREFDFMLSNPPYGKSWKKDLEAMGGKDGMRDPRFKVMHDGEELSLVTRSSDGQLLFLANMASKMNHDTPLGSRIAEVHNGSSLFTGDAGQGESNIRRWIIENDWLEAIVALPLNLFYNTGIATYIWVLTNRKPEHRKGKVQLIDATQWFKPLRKNLGKKNCELAPDDIQRICDTYLAFKETEQSKIFPNAAFGYWKVTVERPLRLHSQLTAESHRVAALRLRRRRPPRLHSTTSSATSSLKTSPAVPPRLRTLVRLGQWRRRGGGRRGRSRRRRACPRKRRKSSSIAKTWERDGRLVETATKLREELGGDLFEDHNLFRDRVDHALKKLDLKLSASDLKLILRAVSWRVETAPPVIAKIHKPGKVQPIRCAGFTMPRTTASRSSSNTNPTPTCATPSKCRCWRRAASKPSSAAKCCPTRRMRGSRKTPPRSATKSASPATSTSRSRFARSTKSAPTSSPWKRKPRACSMNCSWEGRSDRRTSSRTRNTRSRGKHWLGRVPQHWSVLPNRALFGEVKDRDHPDEEMLSVTITRGIVRQKALLADSSKKDSSNQDKSKYKLVQPRDIAYNKMRAWQGAIGASDLRGIISPAYVVVRLREERDLPRYFHHLYRTPHFAKEAERWSYGITSDMWSLRPEHFKMIYARSPRPRSRPQSCGFWTTRTGGWSGRSGRSGR